ncbi:MAG: type IV pilus assembly protein PilM [Planctomycetota bacterium]|nr:type IV pilus assembly protein PilM [Planctomycetota bacterium]
MFGGWRTNQRGPIGVDLGAHSVRMIQLEQGPEGSIVAAAATSELPAGLPASGQIRSDAIAPIIRGMLAASDFSGSKVVSCLPATAVQYKNLRMPKMPPDELAGAIQWEAADRLKLSTEQIQIQYFDAGEVRQGEESREEIILLAAQRETVDEHLRLLLQSGLKPVAIDVVSGALARALGGKPSDDLDAPATVVVDIGYSSSKVLICQSGRVVFFKLIEIGGRKLDQAVAEALKLPVPEAASLRRELQRAAADREAGKSDAQGANPAPAQAAKGDAPRRDNLERVVFDALRATASDVAKELGLCLRYYSVTFRGRRPEAVLLCGGEAHEPLLAKALGEGAGLRVEVARPLSGFGPGRGPALNDESSIQSEWAVAMGLALRRTDRSSRRGAA